MIDEHLLRIEPFLKVNTLNLLHSNQQPRLVACIQVVWLGPMGFGIRTAHPIQNGEAVCEYGGELISAVEAEARAFEFGRIH